MSKNMKFGEFLRSQGLVTDKDIVEARLYQRMNNREVGQIMRSKGWLTEEDMQRVLVLQEEDEDRQFGEIALELNLVTRSQLDEAVEEGLKHYVPIGEALARVGAIDRSVVATKAVEFYRLCREGGSPQVQQYAG